MRHCQTQKTTERPLTACSRFCPAYSEMPTVKKSRHRQKIRFKAAQSNSGTGSPAEHYLSIRREIALICQYPYKPELSILPGPKIAGADSLLFGRQFDEAARLRRGRISDQ